MNATPFRPRRSFRTRAMAAAVGVAVATLGAIGARTIPAHAITGGTIDTANVYSNVGLIAFYDSEGRFRCTATLVSSTVLLTAAHCTTGTIGKTIVTFAPIVALAPPSPLPRAIDDTGDGISQVGYSAASAGGYATGTAYTHPLYSNFTDLKNWNDVGVVVLDSPISNITPARIAPASYLDQFAQPALNKLLVTLVGYGTEVRKPESGPQKPVPMSYPIVRRFTDEVGQKLTPQILQTNGNDKDTRGGGGSCFGDSGGPSFKNGYIVTVTSYGYTSNCRYLGGLQRVDNPGVQSWLATFGVTPPSN